MVSCIDHSISFFFIENDYWTVSLNLAWKLNWYPKMTTPRYKYYTLLIRLTRYPIWWSHMTIWCRNRIGWVIIMWKKKGDGPQYHKVIFAVPFHKPISVTGTLIFTVLIILKAHVFSELLFQSTTPFNSNRLSIWFSPEGDFNGSNSHIDIGVYLMWS